MEIKRVQRPWQAARKDGYTKTNFDKFYHTPLWKKLRRQHIAANPFCAECERQGRKTWGYVVDHKTPIRKGGHATDPGNLQTLCKHCNAVKTAKDK